ncbi:MAG: 4-hydroxybenzoate octaprenyltransferase [Gammaproteobacteria bacterium]|nr:4-hydroxybenzoate octaprenyltransferase [Gammaproteobacteria bacterium]
MNRRSWVERGAIYLRLIRLDRPIGIYLVLWPTLWGLWLAAGGLPPFQLLLIFVSGVVFMRSAGCAINDFADRNIDGHVSRTRTRPLATGEASPREALWLFAILSLLSFLLVLQLNRLTILLSLIALFLAASYPFVKRFTHLPQAYLGVAFGWAIPMAFAAQLGEVPLQSWWLFAVTLLWALAYDTMYAMSDKEDDLRIGVKSSAILFGRYDRLIIAVIQLLILLLLYYIGALFQLGSYYLGGVGIAALFFGYQQLLIADRDPQRCLNAFLNNHYVGLVLFVAITLDYGYR